MKSTFPVGQADFIFPFATVSNMIMNGLKPKYSLYVLQLKKYIKY